mgnify:CR=1 FL=1
MPDTIWLIPDRAHERSGLLPRAPWPRPEPRQLEAATDGGRVDVAGMRDLAVARPEGIGYVHIVDSRKGEARTLSAEGRLSAWILSLLPFGAGLVINLVNPGFLTVLWTDPVGLKLIYGALLMMAFGIWWMTRIVKIRV